MTEHETASAGAVAHAAHPSHGDHPEHATPTETPQELFTRAELQEFDDDDTMAGGTIGKMLALFFLYTVIVMSAVAWWTAHAVTGP